ncbi:ATP-binding protein [Ekhidna sp.]|uniref:ATP-binding protein n=1 Tax=Ekhidna sp. TaxID=2608089 RepID=UPI003516E626
MVKRTIMCCVLLKMLTIPVIAQGVGDTLRIEGANLEDLSNYAVYWVDDSTNPSLSQAIKALDQGQFSSWKSSTRLKLGLNPYPLWIFLNVKNESEKTESYWWSLYSHADTTIIYQKGDAGWSPMDTALFRRPIRERKVPTRFLANEITLAPGEAASLLMKVRNVSTPQHAVTDFTTPAHNLLWEKKFYWSIGFIVGALLLLCFFSFVLGIITGQRIFLLLAIYLAIVTIVVLKEELLVVFFPGPVSFYFLTRLSVIGLTVIGCGLHYLIISFALGNPQDRFSRPLNWFNWIGLIIGLLVTVALFVFEDFNIEYGLYRLIWNGCVVIAILLMIVLSILVLSQIKTPKQAIVYVPLALLLFYFNAAGYVLNYEGVLTYYDITYPNYFFWALCGEFTFYGLLIGWRYKNTLKKNFKLEKEQADHQTELYQKEIETQERERIQIARDIHDDLGATVSAIKLIITNSYTHDEHLVKMANKASADLRYFLGNFSVTNILEDGLFHAVKQRASEINELQLVKLSILTQGNDRIVSQELSLSSYRMVSEIINNIIKHSKASSATIQVLIDEDQLQIIAEDNGCGFNTNQKNEGMGLSNIRMRAARFSGNVHMVSDKRSGTTIIITIPISSAL